MTCIELTPPKCLVCEWPGDTPVCAACAAILPQDAIEAIDEGAWRQRDRAAAVDYRRSQCLSRPSPAGIDNLIAEAKNLASAGESLRRAVGRARLALRRAGRPCPGPGRAEDGGTP